jgi:HD-GYP domain-containing protein (c-di-GMP phosphodiesterase class II)/NO-binding membrane sensor protein with MHYT domain
MRIDLVGLCFSDGVGLHFAHDPGYVLLSYVIAAIGSYTAFDLVERQRHCAPRAARYWQFAAAATLGGSIWAMHFMGMLAVRIGMPTSFKPWLTLLSMVIAVGVVVISIQIALGGSRTRIRIGVAGVVLGIGIATMHYVGMAALQLPGLVTYTPGLWGTSILIAMGAAVVAVSLSLTVNTWWHRLLAAAVMTAAICGMHYTGMAAAVIRVDPLIDTPIGIASGPLAVAVGGTTLALLLLALVSVTADRRLSEAVAREARALHHANAELMATQREIVARLCAAGEFRDNETGAHVMRMAHVAHRLALAAACDPEFAEQLLAAAPLHDIGKIGISDAILFKPRALSASERMVMQEHAALGGRILGGSELPLLKLAAEIAQSHHEKWDGSGYPHGLEENEIPLASRIVAVADVFDALMSERPYKEAWSLNRVMDHMREQAGSHFDPQIVDVMLASVAEILTVWSRHVDPAWPRRRLVVVAENGGPSEPVATRADTIGPSTATVRADSRSFATV